MTAVVPATLGVGGPGEAPPMTAVATSATESAASASVSSTSSPLLDIGVFGIRAIPSTYSGYETFLTALLPELVQRGHSVTVYCRRGERVPDEPGPYLGVRRVDLPSIGTKQLDTMSHGLVCALASRVQGHDVVLSCNVANALYCALLRWTGLPVVLNTDGQEWIRGKWGRVARSVFRASARSSRWSANALISDCDAMRTIYESEFGAASTVIPYSYLERSDDPATRPAHGRSPGSFAVTGGRLVPENNIDAIVDRYVESRLDLPLLVLGAANYDSPVLRRLQSAARRDARIELLGHVSDRSEFLALLGDARVYLHGHSVGGMNPSLVEAMGAGAVIAALGTPFNREVLGPAGLYFDDCEQALDRVLREVDDLSADGAAGVRRANAARARERFSMPEVADAYEAILRRVRACSPRQSIAVRSQWQP